MASSRERGLSHFSLDALARAETEDQLSAVLDAIEGRYRALAPDQQNALLAQLATTLPGKRPAIGERMWEFLTGLASNAVAGTFVAALKPHLGL